MIEHYTEDGRRVYTVSEAATLRGYRQTQSMRKWMERRGVTAQTHAVDWINSKEPVYYPEDLGLEGQ